MGCAHSKSAASVEPTTKDDKEKSSSKPKITAEEITGKITDQLKELENLKGLEKLKGVGDKLSTIYSTITPLDKAVKDEKTKLPILGYWDIKGRAYQIRLLLAYAGVEFTERMYDMENTKDNWEKRDKQILAGMLPLKVPNLPYFISKDVSPDSEKHTVLVETAAIMKHLGRTHGLTPTDDQGKYLSDAFEGIVNDIAEAAYTALMSNDPEKVKSWQKALPETWAPIDTHLKSHKFICGSAVTAIDFTLFAFIEMIEKSAPGCLDELTNLRNFKEGLLANAGLGKYVEAVKDMPWFP